MEMKAYEHKILGLQQQGEPLEEASCGSSDIVGLRQSLDTALQAGEKDLAELKGAYKNKMKTFRQNLELRLKVDIVKVEDQRLKERNRLLQQQTAAKQAVSKYYTQISGIHKRRAAELKREKAQLEIRAKQHNGRIHCLSVKNEKNREIHTGLNMEIARLESALSNSNNEAETLKERQGKLRTLRTTLSQIKAKHSRISVECAEVQAERDEYYSSYEGAIALLSMHSQVTSTPLLQQLPPNDHKLKQQERTLKPLLEQAKL